MFGTAWKNERNKYMWFEQLGNFQTCFRFKTANFARLFRVRKISKYITKMICILERIFSSQLCHQRGISPIYYTLEWTYSFHLELESARFLPHFRMYPTGSNFCFPILRKHVNLVKKHLFALEDAISAQVLEQASLHLLYGPDQWRMDL